MKPLKESLHIIGQCAMNGEEIPFEEFADTYIFKAIRKGGKFFTADGIEIRDAVYRKFYSEVEALHSYERKQL